MDNKYFETYADINMVRILRSTARLLKKAMKSETHNTQLPPPCASSSRMNTTRVQNKANTTDVARILRSAAQLITKLQAAGRRSKVTKEGTHKSAAPEDPIESRTPVEEHTFIKAQTKTPTKAKSLTTPLWSISGGQAAWPCPRQTASQNCRSQ